MEFNYQSINQRSSSSSTYFSSSPFPNPNPTINHTLNHNHNHIYTNYSLHSSSSSSPYLPIPPFPAGFDAPNMRQRDIMQRELEKERIRAEILAEEILRRRVLEEEVRREIMIERDRFLRYGSTRTDSSSRVPLLTNFEETDRFRARFSTWRETRIEGLEPLPFERGSVIGGIGNGSSSGVTLKEIKCTDKEANKEKVIILAKPNLNSTDLKRQTPASGADLEVKSVVPVKKQKTEDKWSCALCQITATSERGLNEHLLGKKHLARERGLVTQKVGFGLSPKPKMTSANNSQKNKVNGGGKTSTKGRENPTQKTSGTEKSMLDEQNSVEKSTRPKRLRLWCDICKVGAHTQKVMNSHKRGKKHLANIRQLNQPSDPVGLQKKSTEENIKLDFANAVVIKQETVAEAEIKGVDSDMPQTDNKDDVDNVADDGITKPRQ